MEYQPTAALADDQLIQYYLNCDPQALETLVYLNKDKIYNSILATVHDKYVANNIFQEVFMQIIDTIMAGKYTEEGKFLPWALHIAHYKCIDYFRKKKLPTETNLGNDRDHEMVVFTEPQPDNITITYENHDKIRKMIDMLPEEQREVIMLRHYADLSFKEISEIMKCNINTALGRMRFALTSLRRIMEEKQIAF